jgi:hypothetical protein
MSRIDRIAEKEDDGFGSKACRNLSEVVFARATVHALQTKKEGSGPTNWGVLEKDLSLTVHQLKALTQVHLPADFNWIPLGSLQGSE